MVSKSNLSSFIPYIAIIIILIVDIAFQFNYIIGFLYLIPITFLGFQDKAKSLIPIAILCTVLIMSYLFFGEKESTILIDKIIACVVIYSFALIFYYREQFLKISLTKVNGLEKQADLVINKIEESSIILINDNGEINNWNQGSKLMFGYEPEEIIGKNISTLLNKENDKSSTFIDLLNELETKEKVSKSIWLQRRSEVIFLSELNMSSLFTASGKKIGIVVNINDVDKKRSLEQMLTATNSLAQVGGWEYDLITDKLFWSTTTKEIHEVEEEYLPNTTEGINFYLEGEDRDRIAKVFGVMVQDGTPFEEELRIITAKGTIKWVRSKAYPIFINNKCVKIYGSFQDIDDKKKQELALINSEKKFKNIFEYSASGMTRINTKGKILEANKKFYELVGYTKEEVDKLTIKDVSHPEDLKRDLLLFKNLDKGEIKSFELDKRFYSGSGKLKWVYLVVSKVTNNEGITDYFIAQLTDITEKKIAAEKLIDKNKELNQYTYITSHDLQEPIRTINSFTEMMAKNYDNVLDETGLKYLRFINEASVRLKNQIKGLLDYNRLGKNDKAVITLDCNKVIKEVELDLLLLIKENNAKIEYSNLPTLKVFEIEFKLLFQNLITNSIKFQKPGNNPIITIKAEEDREFWKFSVSDNGIGIDEKFNEKIFQIFQRLHSKKEFEGSGIGLAHCKKIIEHHEGNIWVISNLGEGCTFYFTINKYL